MNGELTLALAFLAGIAGAGHCWSMCGGFAGGLFLHAPVWRAHLGYHLGRVLTYTLIGALSAALGRALVLTGDIGRAQAALYVLAGLAVTGAGGWAVWRGWRRGCGGCGVGGTHPLPNPPLEGEGVITHPPSNSPLEGGRAHSLPFKGRAGVGMGYTFSGLLNGLMPCSLVFSLALKAAAAPSVAHGAAWLFAFGLGTIPAMAVAGLLAQGLGYPSLRWLRVAAGVLVMALGVEAVVAGAKLFHVLLHL